MIYEIEGLIHPRDARKDMERLAMAVSVPCIPVHLTYLFARIDSSRKLRLLAVMYISEYMNDEKYFFLYLQIAM